MRYKIYECEEKLTSTNKAMKKLVLQGEGKQYPEKNVTMWSDHPLFEEVAVGQTIDVELDIKDSTTPNPHGGFYKNKTVKKDDPSQRPPTGSVPPREDRGPAAAHPGTAELKNILQLQIMPKLEQNNAGIVATQHAIGGLADRLDRFLKIAGEPTKKDVPFDEPSF